MTSTTDAPTLPELLAGVAAADHGAFAELYRRTWSYAFTVVRGILLDESQSEEVTQDVYLEVWQTASRFDPTRGSALTWLGTIARRRAIDRVRSVQATKNRENADWARRQGVPHDEVFEAVDLRFERERMLAAMGSLSELQREALTATYLQDRTFVAAAEFVGASESGLKTRVRDAVIKLRVSLWSQDRAA